MPMRNQLASGTTRVRKAETIDDIIQPRLQHLKQCLTGNAAFPKRSLKVTPELPFHQSVLKPKFLFLSERVRIIGLLASGTLWSMHPGRIVFPFESLAGTE